MDREKSRAPAPPDAARVTCRYVGKSCFSGPRWATTGIMCGKRSRIHEYTIYILYSIILIAKMQREMPPEMPLQLQGEMPRLSRTAT